MIYLLWCTVRPNVFINTHKDWIDKSCNKNNIVTKIAVANKEQADLLKDYDVEIAESNKIGVCYPSYYLSSKLKANSKDIVVLASDDFFAFEGWDEYLIKQFEDFSGGLFVNDGIQMAHVDDYYTAMTIPIMSYDCLEKLNKIIYHPIYTHMFGDNELYQNLKELNLLKDVRNDGCVFEHRHFGQGKRDIDNWDNQYRLDWNKDEDLFKTRLKLSVNERLVV